ncbi:MAG: DUF3352 domain-containing protein [Chloroflexi bacterium]|nr:DUF3352 domain-containing protein [Chloroflexota bacterium]HEV8054171.1 DUF3352 domain-containing protein [Candidatus Limnocylindrales bacterium]
MTAQQPTGAAYPFPATEPVTPEKQQKSSRGRWIVALLATVLVVGAAAALVMVAGRGAGATGAPSYLPAGTVAYVETRLDLPGDQREKVADFLAHFPGFADRAALELKIDDTLDRLVREGTDGEYTYTGDLKPWFGGQVSIGVIEAPEIDAQAMEENPEVPIVGVVSVTDREAAAAVLERIRTDAEREGVTVTSEDHGGVTIYTIPASEGSTEAARYALTEDALLFAMREGDLEAALDRKASGTDTLAGSAEFTASQNGLRGDRVATFYFDTATLRELTEAGLEDLGPASDFMRQQLENYPTSLVSTVHVDSDRLVGEVRMTLPADAERPVPAESTITSRVPATSNVYLEMVDVGKGIGTLVEQLKQAPEAEEMSAELEQVEGILGSDLEDYLDWLDDLAFAGQLEGDTPTGALVGSVTDQETGESRLRQLSALLTLAGAQMGGGVAVDREDYNGTEITTIAVEVPEEIAEGAEDLPIAAGDLEISYAFESGFFMLGLGDEQVKELIDLEPADSLGSSDRFRGALQAAGGPVTSGISYLDLASLRGFAEELVPPDERTRYDQEIEPYVEPLDLLIGTTVQEGETFVSRLHFIVK